jgi:hypothetical protein
MIPKKDIYDLLIKNNKASNVKSINAYSISLFNLGSQYEKISNKSKNKLEFNKNLDWLENTKEVMEVLNTKMSYKGKLFSETTKKNYITSIIVAIRNIYKNDGKWLKIGNVYRDLAYKAMKKYQAYLDTHNKTEREKVNWTSWTSLLKVKNELYKSIKERDILKNEDLKKKDFLLLQKYIIASLYLLEIPRRTEYANCIVINEKDFIDLSNETKKQTNFLVVKSRNKKYFYFTNFKTQRWEGNIRVDVNSKLNTVLNLWLKHIPPKTKEEDIFSKKWLLYNNSLKKMSNNNLVKNIQKIFSGTGKKISVTMLRHIFTSEKGVLKDIDPVKLHEEAKKSSHSVKRHIEYIKV